MHVVGYNVIHLSLLCSMCCHVSYCTAQIGHLTILYVVLQSGSEPCTTVETCAGTVQAMCYFSWLLLNAAPSQAIVSKLVW